MLRSAAAVAALVLFSVTSSDARPVDTTTITCKEYNAGSHQDMVDVGAAFYQATRSDSKFGAMKEGELGDLIDKLCADKPTATVADVLKSSP